MAKYKVRDGFVVFLVVDERGNERAYVKGEEVELSEKQVALYAHAIEPVDPPATKGKAAA